MSYRNPKIIVDTSGEIIGQTLADLGKSVAMGLQTKISKEEQLRKDRKAEIAEQQKIHNGIQNKYNEKAFNFNVGLPKNVLNNEIRPIITETLNAAADAEIALLTETDPKKRAELNKVVQDADEFLVRTNEFVTGLSEDGAEYGQLTNAQIETEYSVNGMGKFDRANNAGFMGFASGKASGNFSIQKNKETNSLDLFSFGELPDGSKWDKKLNSSEYLASNGEMIVKIPNVSKEIIDETKKMVTDGKNNFLPSVFLEESFKRVPLAVKNQKGEVVGKKRVEGKIKEVNLSQIQRQIVPAVNSNIDAFFAMTATQQDRVYQNQLNGSANNITDFYNTYQTADAQIEHLKPLMEKIAIDGIIEGLDSYIDTDGNTVYFQATEKLKEITPPPPPPREKPTAADIKAKQADDRATELVKKLDEEGVQAFIKSISSSTQFKQLGNTVTLLDVDTEGKTVEGNSYNIGTKSGKESFLNDFAKAKYGTGADFDLIQDYISKKVKATVKEAKGPSVSTGPVDYSKFLIKE